jgi:hypothetical protein
MGLFSRKKDVEPDEELEVAAEVPEAAAAPSEPARTTGPWDQADAPEDGLNRIDLGGLLVPVPPEVEVRVDVSPEGQVVAATLVKGQSALQVNAFAAPRREGIWAEVRAEIASALEQQGGRASEVEGPYGVELHAAVPAEVPGQGRGLAPARFLGVDGPRWFLRGLLTGPAAVEAAEAEPLLRSLRDCVVVRGTEAMAVRDPLPLRLPKEVADAAAAQAEGQREERQAPAVPERGPEITETR